MYCTTKNQDVEPVPFGRDGRRVKCPACGSILDADTMNDAPESPSEQAIPINRQPGRRTANG